MSQVFVLTRSFPSTDHPAGSIESGRSVLGVFTSQLDALAHIKEDIQRREKQGENIAYEIKGRHPDHLVVARAEIHPSEDRLVYWRADYYEAIAHEIDDPEGYL